MSEYHVYKTGFQNFDQYHALGLAVALSEYDNMAVRVRDTGVAYSIERHARVKRREHGCTITEILRIPSALQFDRATQLELGNLDGLLAATFTMPGVRLTSVADLRAKHAQRPQVVVDAIRKVTSLINRIPKSISTDTADTTDWLPELLEEYCPTHAAPPQHRMSDRKQLTLTLPLEPAFGYGTRQPTSDGFISRKDSISINAPSAAGAFAYIGAARYLRAQRTKGAIVLLISPRFTDLLVKPGAVGRRLSSLSTDVEQAIYGNWLASWRRDHAHSRGLAVHLVQTQGAKQSISVNRIELSFDPLNRLAASNCRKLIWRWERQLEANAGNLTEYIDTLLSLLHSFDRDSIYRHLTETARYHQSASESTPEYELEEIKAMIGLYPDTKSSMAQVINRTNGTARFGRAIRLLNEQNRSAAREILEDLEAVRSQDQLLRVLARAQQKFVLAKASTDFIVIPTEEDLAVLLDDIAQFGATEIAGLLIILTTVRYPKVADQPNATPSSAPTDTTTTNPTQEENQNYVS